MGKKRKNYPLRLPEELFAKLRRWADQEMRSVNAQIEYILNQAIKNRFGSASNDNETDATNSTGNDRKDDPENDSNSGATSQE